MADYTLPGRAFARKENIEIRYNPYHDPSNGRFCSGGGGGGGAMLVVNKGQKGNGFYVYDSELYGIKKNTAKKSSSKKSAKDKDILSSDNIRKYGFESADELKDYAVNRFISSGAINDRLRREVEIDSLLPDMAIIRNGRNGVNRDLAQYLKDKLDVSVEQYGHNDYLVSMKRTSAGMKKRKRPKSLSV
jgi:hypothetical protein